MSLDTLLEKINSRKIKAEQLFPALMRRRDAASTISEGTLAFYDVMVMQKAMSELFIFEDYFLQLDNLTPSSQEENTKIQSTKSELETIIIVLAKISGTKKYNSPVDSRMVKQNHSSSANYNLIDAAKADDIEGVEAAISAGANINFEHLNDYALKFAVKNKNHVMASTLIAAGANVNIVAGMFTDTTPLLIATDNNDLEMAQMLISKGVNPNKPSKDLESPLYVACFKPYVSLALLNLLLNTPGINLNEKIFGHSHATALSAALSDQDDRKAKCLLKAGTTIHECDFHTALNRGINTTRLLLDAGYPCTAERLIKAIDTNNAEVINLLLSRSNDVIVEETKSKLKKRQYSDLMFYVALGKIETVKKLLAHTTIDINAFNLEGDTALLIAARLGHVEMADLLLKKGAAVDAQVYGTDATPLMIAAKNGHTKLVKLLLAQGADVNKPNDRYPKGATALFVATTAKQAEVVETLLNLDDIDMVVKTEHGESAVELGLRSTNQRIVDAYKTKIAKPHIAKIQIEIQKQISHFKEEGKAFINVNNNKKAQKIEDALKRANKTSHFSIQDFLNYKEAAEESILDALKYKRFGFFSDPTSMKQINDFVQQYEPLERSM